MTGLEKMKSRILEEARSSAEVKIQDANRQARELLDERKRQAEGSAAAILEKARADAEGLKEKALSASDLERRTRLLGARQEMIAEVLKEAYRKIKDMDTAAYFELIERLLDHYVLPRWERSIFHLRTHSACRTDLRKRYRRRPRQREAPFLWQRGILLYPTGSCWCTAGSKRTVPLKPSLRQGGMR